MDTWTLDAKLQSIPGTVLSIRGHKIVGTQSADLDLEKGAQSAHFRFYWTEDSTQITTMGGVQPDATHPATTHHIESRVVNGRTFSPFELVQALANTMECGWEMLFTAWQSGGYGFRDLPVIRSHLSDGRIPVYLSDLEAWARKIGEASNNPEHGAISLYRRVVNDPQFSTAHPEHALLRHDTPIHELFHLIQVEYLGGLATVNWLVEGMAELIQRTWRGYRSVPFAVGDIYDNWNGVGSVIDNPRSDYAVAEFWDNIGRRLTRAPYAARISTPLCAILDARKDIYPGIDVLQHILDERTRIQGPAPERDKVVQAIVNVARARGTSLDADEIEWGFVAKDWLGEDVITGITENAGRFRLYEKAYAGLVSGSQYRNVLELPAVMESIFDENTPVQWQQLGGQVLSAPSVVRFNNQGRGQVHLFARGSDGTLWTNIQVANVWVGWHSIATQLDGDATITSMPVATIQELDGRGKIHVFARGRQGQLWQAVFDGSRWRGPFSFPGKLLRGHPAVACRTILKRRRRPGADWYVGELHVFLWAPDGSLETARYAPATPLAPPRWSGWKKIGSLAYSSSPTAISVRRGGEQEVCVYIRDDTNHLREFVLREGERWPVASAGTEVQGDLKSAPSAIITQTGAVETLYIFTRRDQSGALSRILKTDAGWSGWGNI